MQEWGDGGWDKWELALFAVMMGSSLAMMGFVIWFLVTLAGKLG